MNDESPPPKIPRLGEIGLTNFAPYLMNRIMGAIMRACAMRWPIWG